MEQTKVAPPASYKVFVAEALHTFVAKDTDYDSRFMRGMIALDAWTLWAWEVDKKLDRLRTWLQRGELQVKGEGVENSVQDLFNYTVQYAYYLRYKGTVFEAGTKKYITDWQSFRVPIFNATALQYSAALWVQFLVTEERIRPDEIALQNILRLYMGDNPTALEWQEAIRSILEK